MGYDMHVLNADGSRDSGTGYWTLPEGPEREAAEKLHDERYFRLNIWGMGNLRSLMSPVLDCDKDHSEWPDAPEGDEHFDGDDQPLTEAGRAYEAASDAVRRERSPDPAKVPVFKFGSNDAWVVTPDECRIMIAHAQKLIDNLRHGSWVEFLRAVPEEDRDAAQRNWLGILREFVTFAQRGAAEGGFDVC